MKKLKLAIVSIILMLTSSFSVVYANGIGNFSFPNPVGFNTLEDIINAALGLIRPIFIVTFAAMILYAAWVWLTSQGDDEKIGRARKIIIAAIIGFALAVLAPSIASVVGSFIGLKGLGTT